MHLPNEAHVGVALNGDFAIRDAGLAHEGAALEFQVAEQPVDGIGVKIIAELDTM